MASPRAHAPHNVVLVAWVLFLLALFCPYRATAQSGIDRIALGPLDISLGDDQARTLDKLRGRYALSEEHADPKIGPFSPGITAWAFGAADESGHVTFSYGRVTSVIHTWSPRLSALDVSRSFIDVLYRLMKDGKDQCRAFPPAAVGIGPVRAMSLQCGHNVVSLFADDAKVTMMETLDDGR